MRTAHARRLLSLYKSVLRLHTCLPDELRALGDTYVRAEFRRHKQLAPDSDKAATFEAEWMRYTDALRGQARDGVVALGEQMTGEQLDTLADHQLVQLYDLMKEATGPPPAPPTNQGSVGSD